jgi:hypothetical protein
MRKLKPHTANAHCYGQLIDALSYLRRGAALELTRIRLLLDRYGVEADRTLEGLAGCLRDEQALIVLSHELAQYVWSLLPRHEQQRFSNGGPEIYGPEELNP